mgnify:FL=1|jgi:bacterioferritin
MSLNPQESIDILNLARSMELVAIGQYMQHHYALNNLMFPTFAKAVKKIAISEMRHAEMLSERIRELGGIPIVAPAQNVDTNQEPMVVFATDADLERDTVFKYNEYIQKLSEIDHVSAQLLKKIIVEEEGHSQYFQDVVDHLTQLGPHYLAVQAGGAFDKTDYEKFIIG